VNFAYADPPYLGQGTRYGFPEWDTVAAHQDLISRLVREYPDGWALSCSTPSLCDLLPLCPRDVRVAAWVKPFASFKPGVNPAYAWEPVLFRGGRKRDRRQPTVRDWHSENITLKRGLVGAKPPAFGAWIVALLGATIGDTIDDLFPGTGAVSRSIAETGVVARKP
jgi:hypothetical protein